MGDHQSLSKNTETYAEWRNCVV